MKIPRMTITVNASGIRKLANQGAAVNAASAAQTTICRTAPGGEMTARASQIMADSNSAWAAHGNHRLTRQCMASIQGP